MNLTVNFKSLINNNREFIMKLNFKNLDYEESRKVFTI